MKTKNVQGIICLVFLFLFANHAWATDWVPFASTSMGIVYYDISSIKKVNKNIIRVWTERIFNEEGKTDVLSFLKKIGKAPDNPEILRSIKNLWEIDCVNEKSKISFQIIYDEKGKGLHSDHEITKWEYIVPGATDERLKNIVCSGDKTAKTEKK